MTNRVLRDPDKASGGTFSTGYIVENDDGRHGFLKAMDYARAMRSGNSVDEMKRQLEKYIFERDLCLVCRDHSLDRVIHAIDFGTHIVDPEHPMSEFFKVEYLIFELADGGDIRVHLETEEGCGDVFKLRALHNIACALQQLHRHGIAHQDLKPSNVMVFARDRSSKVGDLGRAWARGIVGPYDETDVPGDAGYVPYELLCRKSVSIEQRRFGCDMYMFGSLFFFFFVKMHLNPIIEGFLHPSRQVRRARYDFDELLPYLEAAFDEAIYQFGQCVAEYLRPELVGMVTQLCHPDPDRRGHPSYRRFHQHSLEYYISRLNHMAWLAEVRERRGG